MCDTMAIIRPDGVIFAKNSDRDANEAQNIEWHPRRINGPGATLRCTWIEIPEVEETCATLLSRPFWIWGAEMGANEHGVTIGNESVFTKEPYVKRGLLGMDLLRLALERADTAKGAVEVMARLLEAHGQGGGAGLEHKGFVYHNSFIVADPRGAFVFETAGRKWAVEEITSARSISNRLTIEDFRAEYSGSVFSKARLYTGIAQGFARQCRTQSLLDTNGGPAEAARILMDHGEGNDSPKYSWINGSMAAPCVHGGGLLTSSQTTGSLIADLRPGGCRIWVTGTSSPCLALYKPVRVDEPVDLGAAGTDRAGDSLWWRHERLQRAVMRNPGELMPLFIPERDAVQARWFEDPPESREAFAEADELVTKWTEVVSARRVPDLRPIWTRRYWAKRNQHAGL